MLWLLAFGIGAISYGAFGKTFTRKRTRLPDPHPGRMRFALIGVGLAILLLAISEFLNRR